MARRFDNSQRSLEDTEIDILHLLELQINTQDIKLGFYSLNNYQGSFRRLKKISSNKWEHCTETHNYRKIYILFGKLGMSDSWSRFYKGNYMSSILH